MAMVSALMEQEIKLELTTQHPIIFPEVAGDATQAANAARLMSLIAKIAAPIISHIQNNATVLPGIATNTGATIAPGFIQ